MPNYMNWTPQNAMPATWQPNMQYQSYQPYNAAQPNSYHYSSQPRDNILKAMGPESAKAYPMGPNETIVIFDANEATFYMISTDDSAFKSMRTFDFTERKQVDIQPVVEAFDTSDFATKEDLDAIKDELAEMTKTLKGLM